MTGGRRLPPGASAGRLIAAAVMGGSAVIVLAAPNLWRDDAALAERGILALWLIGAIACFRRAVLVERLPKTRSGKILRRVIRQIADGDEWIAPSTIDDPAILTEIDQKMRRK